MVPRVGIIINFHKSSMQEKSAFLCETRKVIIFPITFQIVAHRSNTFLYLPEARSVQDNTNSKNVSLLSVKKYFSEMRRGKESDPQSVQKVQQCFRLLKWIMFVSYLHSFGLLLFVKWHKSNSSLSYISVNL